MRTDIYSLTSRRSIVAPITKESAGSLFHEELARSICGWLAGPAGRALCPDGLVTLPDVYCAYNRAR